MAVDILKTCDLLSNIQKCYIFMITLAEEQTCTSLGERNNPELLKINV